MVSLGATADYSLKNAAATSSASASSPCSNRNTRECFLPKFSLSISWDSQTKSAHQSINLEQALDAAVQCIRAADAIAYTQTTCPNANPVHRLGRATTGIVLFAKTPQAAANLFANWNTPKIQKIYRAPQNIVGPKPRQRKLAPTRLPLLKIIGPRGGAL